MRFAIYLSFITIIFLFQIGTLFQKSSSPRKTVQMHVFKKGMTETNRSCCHFQMENSMTLNKTYVLKAVRFQQVEFFCKTIPAMSHLEVSVFSAVL